VCLSSVSPIGQCHSILDFLEKVEGIRSRRNAHAN
jgi:hypothetical protein